MTKSAFKLDHTFEERLAESTRVKEKYPDRIPVIVDRARRTDIPNIEAKKFLLRTNMTVGRFVYLIRDIIHLNAEKAIFIFVNDILPPTGSLMSALYDEHKDEDGFLYMTYCGENTFGFSTDSVELKGKSSFE